MPGMLQRVPTEGFVFLGLKLLQGTCWRRFSLVEIAAEMVDTEPLNRMFPRAPLLSSASVSPIKDDNRRQFGAPHRKLLKLSGQDFAHTKHHLPVWDTPLQAPRPQE